MEGGDGGGGAGEERPTSVVNGCLLRLHRSTMQLNQPTTDDLANASLPPTFLASMQWRECTNASTKPYLKGNTSTRCRPLVWPAS